MKVCSRYTESKSLPYRKVSATEKCPLHLVRCCSVKLLSFYLKDVRFDCAKCPLRLAVIQSWCSHTVSHWSLYGRSAETRCPVTISRGSDQKKRRTLRVETIRTGVCPPSQCSHNPRHWSLSGKIWARRSQARIAPGYAAGQGARIAPRYMEGQAGTIVPCSGAGQARTIAPDYGAGEGEEFFIYFLAFGKKTYFWIQGLSLSKKLHIASRPCAFLRQITHLQC